MKMMVRVLGRGTLLYMYFADEYHTEQASKQARDGGREGRREAGREGGRQGEVRGRERYTHTRICRSAWSPTHRAQPVRWHDQAHPRRCL